MFEVIIFSIHQVIAFCKTNTTEVDRYFDAVTDILMLVHKSCCKHSLQIKSKQIQGFSWTEIRFGHFVRAAPILFGHLEIF